MPHWNTEEESRLRNCLHELLLWSSILHGEKHQRIEVCHFCPVCLLLFTPRQYLAYLLSFIRFNLQAHHCFLVQTRCCRQSQCLSDYPKLLIHHQCLLEVELNHYLSCYVSNLLRTVDWLMSSNYLNEKQFISSVYFLEQMGVLCNHHQIHRRHLQA